MSNPMDEMQFFEHLDEPILSSPAASQNGSSQENWTVLIIDDEPDVHQATELALRKFVFKGKGLNLLNAYSTPEARAFLYQHKHNIAVILLDIAMEENDSGLKLIEYIRNELNDQLVRIMLRTGQSDQLPAEELIVKYEINDYKLKSELTADRLFVTLVTAIRAYDDLRALEFNQQELAKTYAELKATEQALKHQQTYLRQIIDINPHFVFAKDREGRFTLVNQAFAKAYGATVEEIVGKTDSDFNPHTSLVERYNRDDLKVIETGQDLFIEEEQVVNVKGQSLWRKTVKRPILDDEGQPFQVLGVATDITQLKTTELALRESEERLRTFIGALPDITFINDEYGLYVEVLAADDNPLYKGAVELLKGKYMYEVLPPDKAELFLRVIHTTLQTGRSQVVEYELDTPLGRVWFEGRTSPIQSHRNETRRVVWLARDISEHKRLGQQVRQSLDRRERQIRVATQIAQETATATHLDDLYRKVVAQIKEQFGFYHVELFRHETEMKMLPLVAGYGEIGRQMLFEDYQIPIGNGVVGLAAAIGASVRRSNLIDDVGGQPDPRLTNTRDELAVPIQFGRVNAHTQATALQGFIDSHLDGFIVFSIDPAVVAPVTKAALANGLKVVTQTVNLGQPNQTSFVGMDDYKAGYLLGQEAGEWAKMHLPVHQPLKVALFNYPSLPQVVKREAGIMASIKDHFGPNFEIIAREETVDPAGAASIAQRWLQLYPDLKMVLSINDAGALGAYRALSDTDKNKADQFFIGGIDATNDALNALAEAGAFQVTINQSVVKIAQISVRTLVAALTDQPYEREVVIDPESITRQNLDAFLADRRRERQEGDGAPLNMAVPEFTIGLSVMDRKNPFFADLIEAVEEEVERLGGHLVVNDPKPVLGVLNIHLDTFDALDAEDQLVLEGLCGQIAVAIEKTHLIEEVGIFRQFAEASGQGWGLVTLEGRMAYVNPALAAMMDKPPADLVDRPLTELYRGDSRHRLENEVLPAVWQKGHWSGESTIGSVSGRTVPTFENYFLLKDDNNIPIYIAASITDITERKRAEAELETRLQELNALQRMMSHEGWRSFLATQEESIQGYLFDQNVIKPVRSEQDDLRLELPSLASGGEARQTVTRSISLGGEVIGQLGIHQTSSDQPLGAEDQEFLSLVVEQVSEAMERARLLEQTQKRAVELETVAQVGTIASTTLEVEALLQTVVDLTKSSFDLYHAHIYLLNEREDTLVLAAGAGEIGRQLVSRSWSIPRDKAHSLVALAARTQEGVLSNDVRKEPDFLVNPLLPDTRSELAVPLMVGERVLGVLDVQDNTINRFTEIDVRIQSTLATQIAVALENARLFEQQRAGATELEKQARRLAVLNEMSAELTAVQTLDRTFKIAAVRANEIFEGATVWITLLTEQGDEYKFVAVEDDEPDSSISLPVVGTAIKQAIEANYLVNYPDFRELDWLDTHQLLKQGFHSALIMPLSNTGKIIGTFNVADKNVNAFSPSDESLMRQLGSILSSFIESRRLFEQTQTALAETETLYDLVGMLSSATTLEDILHTAISPAIGVSSAELFIIEPDAAGQPEWIELRVEWNITNQPQMPPGSRFYLPNFAMAKLWISDPDEPILMGNVFQDNRVGPEEKALFKQFSINASVILPLKLGEKWIGLIPLNWADIQQFTDKDRRLYQSIAAQTAVVVNNLLLLEQAQFNLMETERRYQVASRISEARDLQELMMVIISEGPVQIFNRAVLFAYERSGDQTEVEAVVVAANWYSGQGTPPSPIGRRYPLAEFPLFKLTLSPDPIFIDNTQTDERADPGMAIVAQQQEIKAMIVLPLRAGGRPQGVLFLQSDLAYEFTPQDRQGYLALSPQIAAAVENQRLLEETRQALTEVEAVQRRYTVQAWEAYSQQRSVYGYQKVEEQVTPITDDNLFVGPNNFAVERKGTMINASPNITINDKSDTDHRQSPSNLVVPLTVRNEVIGMLGVEETRESTPWSAEEIALVKAIAEQIAQAAENIRLLDETQSRAARERRVNEIGEKIQAAQSLEEALRIAVKEVGLSLQAPQTTVRLEAK